MGASCCRSSRRHRAQGLGREVDDGARRSEHRQDALRDRRRHALPARFGDKLVPAAAPVQQPDDVSRTAHASDSDRAARVHANLHGVPVTPQRLQTRSQCRSHSWQGATPDRHSRRATGLQAGNGEQVPGPPGHSPPFPGSGKRPRPGDPLAREARLARPGGQAHPVDDAVHIVGSTRRVACGYVCTPV